MAWPHRVHRLACRVHTRGSAQAFAWRRELRAAAEDWPALFDAALEAASRRLALGERTLHLPRLELRVEAADAQALVRALPAALAAALAHCTPGDEGGARRSGPTGGPPLVPAATRTSTGAAREALLHLLDHGRLPWDWDGVEREAVLPRLREAALRLLDETLAAPQRWRRWAEAQPLRVVRWARWIDDVALDAPSPPAADAAPWPPALHAAGVAAQRLWWRLTQATDATLRALPPAPAAGEHGASEHPPEVPAPQAEVGVPAPPAAPPHAPALHQARRDAVASGAPPAWHAADAGLVLLHPFLPRLFEACGLLAPPARAIDPAQQPRAAALLHWLATGRDDALEHELTLAKLLAGVAPDVPLQPAPTLAPAWRDEGHALLAAAIAHWGALGSTGIEGLRVSFLQRRGRLVREDAAWRLTVAGEAFDVLLARLPWALSRVHLPWLREPLAVEWVA